MKSSDLKHYEHYESYLNSTLTSWDSSRRLALAAAMAERWIPAYEAFSRVEQWGDLPGFQKALLAVWDHLCGRAMDAASCSGWIRRIDDGTPHMDDFDAYQALASCVILKEALDACRTNENLSSVEECLRSGFEAANGDSVLDSDDLPRIWKRRAVQKELGTQLDLIERVASWPRVDEATVLEFRTLVQSKRYRGPLIARAVPKKEAGPPRISNQDAFEQYRKRLESILSRPVWQPPTPTGYMLAMSYQSQWGTRYLLRMETVSGKTITGQAFQLHDDVAVQRLHARNLQREQNDPVDPEWDPVIRECLALCLANPMNRYDAKAIGEPHGYGPSIRRLFNDAKRSNASDAAAWQCVVDWARHRPAAWDAEDRRRKRGKVTYAVELNERLSQTLHWTTTGDPVFPWTTESKGVRLNVRLNDFPDDVMYQCFADDVDIGSFHDWPANWQR